MYSILCRSGSEMCRIAASLQQVSSFMPSLMAMLRMLREWNCWGLYWWSPQNVCLGEKVQKGWSFFGGTCYSCCKCGKACKYLTGGLSFLCWWSQNTAFSHAVNKRVDGRHQTPCRNHQGCSSILYSFRGINRLPASTIFSAVCRGGKDAVRQQPCHKGGLAKQG